MAAPARMDACPDAALIQYRAFVDLMNDFCRAAGMELPTADPGANRAIAFDVIVDGVGFLVHYSQAIDDRALFVEGRFGAVPPENTLAILRRLLEVNVALAPRFMASFGINAETNEVIYSFSCRLGETDARSLQKAMSLVARQARLWRAGHFLEGTTLKNEATAFGFNIMEWRV
jgi:hypothetical protein